MAKHRQPRATGRSGIVCPGASAPSVSGLGVDVPELQRARKLWSLNRLDESLELFEQALRKYPQNLLALVDASRAFGARFEIRRAEALLDRMVKLGQRQPDVQHLAGQSYRMIFRPVRAIECFERVLKLTREIPDAYLELAVLYERRHRLEESYELIEQCLRGAPDYFEAELFKARLLRRLKDEASTKAILRRLAAEQRAAPEVRAQAWAEIAHLHDRHEEYDAAFGAMCKSKELLLAREGRLLEQAETVMAHLRALVSSITSEHFTRWKAQARAFPTARVAVLTGFPRSGTTLLEQVLDSHSSVISSDEREAFARDIFPALWLGAATPAPTAEALDGAPLDRLGHLRGRYLSYMETALDEPIGQRVHVDKNPTLTVVLAGFLRLFPEAHCLVSLRDPRDVILSCFMQYLPLNSNSVYFLTLERAARRYSNDFGLWRQLRGKIASPWLETRYEDTVHDLEAQARRVLDFLGLPWESGVLSYRDRLKEKAVNSPTYEAVSQPLYTRAIGRWRHYEKYFADAMPILRPLIEDLGYA